MKNKIHLESDKPDWAKNMSSYKKTRFCACGQSDFCGDDIYFTDSLDKITCLQCVQKLFKDGKIRLIWSK